MPFTTLAYIAFFTVVFLAYYVIPKRFQWVLLLVASIFFYGFSSLYYLIFLAVTIVITYAGACGMDNNLRAQECRIKKGGSDWGRAEKKAYKASMQRKRRWMLVGVIVGLVSMLAVFKYGQFIFDNVAWLYELLGLHLESTTFGLILPIGLSFYVFQALGYCIDVQREEVAAERNFLRHALYISYFPQILQGPIGNYGRLAPQLASHKSFEYQQVVFGIQRVAWGLFKKLVIANNIAERINPCWESISNYSGSLCWCCILALYAVQLYADFSGYMDIACGCSEMLGIRMDENFRTPYFSKSIPEFWRRWHITLGAWFKDYLFYPILRSDWNASLRKRCSSSKYLSSVAPTVLGLLIVWFSIGLWHGARWTYVAYGLFHGFFVILAVALGPFYDRLSRTVPRLYHSRVVDALRICRTFAIVMFGYSLFKSSSFTDSFEIWRQLLRVGDYSGVLELANNGGYGLRWIAVWVLCLAAVDCWHLTHEPGALRIAISRRNAWIRYAFYAVSLMLLLYNGNFFPGVIEFEYFKF